jgi:hypothetical protein
VKVDNPGPVGLGGIQVPAVDSGCQVPAPLMAGAHFNCTATRSVMQANSAMQAILHASDPPLLACQGRSCAGTALKRLHSGFTCRGCSTRFSFAASSVITVHDACMTAAVSVC